MQLVVVLFIQLDSCSLALQNFLFENFNEGIFVELDLVGLVLLSLLQKLDGRQGNRHFYFAQLKVLVKLQE